jgi:alpha-L-fucosidase
MNSERAKEIAGLVKKLKPECIMDDRLGGGCPGDFKVQWWAPQQVQRGDWERHGSMNFASWGFIKNNSNCSTDARSFLGFLIDAASKGGNYILNITPDAEGQIPQAQIKCLTQMGQWLRVNGEAIYGATATPFGAEFGTFDAEKKDQNGKPAFRTTRDWRCTAKPGKLYIHIFTWPASRKLELPGLQGKVSKATLLAAAGEPVGVEQSPTVTTLALPEKAPDPIASVVRLELADNVDVLKMMEPRKAAETKQTKAEGKAIDP